MTDTQPESQIVSEIYDSHNDVQREVMEIEIRKTRNKLFTIAVVIFLFDLLALLAANLVTSEALLIILVVPVIIAGLGLLANKEPLIAMIVSTIIIVGIWVYAVVITNGTAAISGWISKAIIIYLLIAGFQSAKEANKIKRELKV
jgi:hypothetical protein